MGPADFGAGDPCLPFGPGSSLDGRLTCWVSDLCLAGRQLLPVGVQSLLVIVLLVVKSTVLAADNVSPFFCPQRIKFSQSLATPIGFMATWGTLQADS